MRRFSYVLIVCSCLFLLTAEGYYFSYQLGKLRYLRDTAISAAGNRTDPAALLSGSYRGRKGCYPASGRFCLRGHGDFEESLPMSVREKIQEEYRLNSRQELYSFLENYSS